MMVVPWKAASADQPARQGQAKQRGQGSTSGFATSSADFGWKKEPNIAWNHPNLIYIISYDVYLVHLENLVKGREYLEVKTYDRVHREVD